MIQFKDCSVPVKIAIVSAWVCGIYLAAAFVVGFVIGMAEAI